MAQPITRWFIGADCKAWRTAQAAIGGGAPIKTYPLGNGEPVTNVTCVKGKGSGNKLRLTFGDDSTVTPVTVSVLEMLSELPADSPNSIHATFKNHSRGAYNRGAIAGAVHPCPSPPLSPCCPPCARGLFLNEPTLLLSMHPRCAVALLRIVSLSFPSRA
jgi:hypothetical protein